RTCNFNFPRVPIPCHNMGETPTMPTKALITGIGHAVPPKILSNHDLEKMVDTNDEWITQRTGIKERRICGPTETASTLSVGAAKTALALSKTPATDLDMIICATVTGDMPFPATACLIQDRLGASKAGAFDLGAACAGFIYAVSVAA